MGARPLRRAIQRYIEDPLADFVLRAEFMPGGTVMVDKAEVVKTDIACDNGVIHVLDAVLMPKPTPKQ